MRVGLRFDSVALVSWFWVAFLVIVVVAGGASRIDSFAQIPVELAASVMLGVALAFLSKDQAMRYGGPIVFATACVALVALQLVPLPPAIWSALPGHGFYKQAADLAEIPQPWRPISISPDLTWSSLTGLLAPLAALLTVATLGRQRTIALLPMLLVVIILNISLGLAQLGGGEGSALRYYAITNNDTPVGMFSNRNHLGILLAIGIPLLAFWVDWGERGERGLPRGWIALACFVLLLPMILLTGSRSGMILGVLGIAVAAGVLRRKARNAISRGTAMIGGVAAVIVVGAVIGLIKASRAFALDRLLQADYATEARVKVVAPAFKMIETFAPFGAGFGTFDQAFRRFEPYRMLAPEYMNHAHSEILELPIEAGLLGVALLAVYLVWWVRRTVRIWSSHKSRSFALARPGTVITGMILLASIAEYPLRTPFFAVLMMIASLWMLPARDDGPSTVPT
jgi:O-antigen ligase